MLHVFINTPNGPDPHPEWFVVGGSAVEAGRPGGVSGYPRAWYIGQFREFESPRVHTRICS